MHPDSSVRRRPPKRWPPRGDHGDRRQPPLVALTSEAPLWWHPTSGVVPRISPDGAAPTWSSSSISFETSRPPESSAMLQVIPQSSRLIRPRASKIACWPPRGSTTARSPRMASPSAPCFLAGIGALAVAIAVAPSRPMPRTAATCGAAQTDTAATSLDADGARDQLRARVRGEFGGSGLLRRLGSPGWQYTAARRAGVRGRQPHRDRHPAARRARLRPLLLRPLRLSAALLAAGALGIGLLATGQTTASTVGAIVAIAGTWGSPASSGPRLCGPTPRPRPCHRHHAPAALGGIVGRLPPCGLPSWPITRRRENGPLQVRSGPFS
jgi:hypothetical protein